MLGTVKKITSYGMFVDVGGLDGLVHYSKISHKGAVKSRQNTLKEGDEGNVGRLRFWIRKKNLFHSP